MGSHGGFKWPESGYVSAADWDPEPRCGGGLHGLAWGAGDGSLLGWGPVARWVVVEVPAAEIVDLGGKVKFPYGWVVYAGGRAGALSFIAAYPGAADHAVIDPAAPRTGSQTGLLTHLAGQFHDGPGVADVLATVVTEAGTSAAIDRLLAAGGTRPYATGVGERPDDVPRG